MYTSGRMHGPTPEKKRLKKGAYSCENPTDQGRRNWCTKCTEISENAKAAPRSPRKIPDPNTVNSQVFTKYRCGRQGQPLRCPESNAAGRMSVFGRESFDLGITGTSNCFHFPSSRQNGASQWQTPGDFFYPVSIMPSLAIELMP